MVKIYWTGLQELMQSEKVSKIEQQEIMNRLSNIQAGFLQRVGFEGKFEVKSVTTSGLIKSGVQFHGGRTSWRIVAADAKTTAALKREPGWLAKFL